MAKTTARVKSLRETLERKVADIEGMSASWKQESGGEFVLSADEAKSYQAAVADAEEIKGLIAAEEKVGSMRAYLDAPEGASFAGQDAAESNRGPEVKSLAGHFIDSDAYQSMKAGGFKRLGESHTIEGWDIGTLGQIGQKDTWTGKFGTIPNIPLMGRAQDVGWTQRTLRPNRVRDLFPVERTNASVLYGIRETGFINRAKIVPDREIAQAHTSGNDLTVVTREVFGLKPKSDLTLAVVTYPISTIAHLMDVHKHALDDEPRLRGLLDRDMVDGIKMVEDFEILYGSGTGDEMTGIVNTAGVQTYAQVTGDKKSAALRRSATRAMLAYFQPTGIAMHPFDWEDIELETDANGAYTVAVSVAVGGEKRVWRMEVVDTPAIVEGRWLLGAFGTGAKVYDREQVSVTVSTENRDNYERNVVTLRAEERLALEVSRPESFVYGSFLP